METALQQMFKCNTDGASKGNPQQNSYDFCIRNDAGYVLFAKAMELGLSTNIVAKARAIVKGLSFYV